MSRWWLPLGGALLAIGVAAGLGALLAGCGDGESAAPFSPVSPPAQAPPAAAPPEVEPPAAEPAEVAPPVVAQPEPASGALVYASKRDGDLDIYAMALDGTGKLRLTDHPAADRAPRFAPDGTRIAFTSNRDGDHDIYLMNADGSGVTQLTQDAVAEGRPSFSPDGTRLVFAAGSGAGSDLWLVNSDGSGLLRLTENEVEEREPVWSPDGATVVLARWDGSDDELWAIDLATGAETQLTRNRADDRAPAFSPDGLAIVFSSDRRNGDSDLWAIDADGSDPRRLTAVAGNDTMPAFAGEGSQIVFQSDRDGDLEILVMNADGTDQTPLTEDLTPDLEPDFSPLATLPTAVEPPDFLVDPTAFPTRREALLLSHVPDRTRLTCARERRQDLPDGAIAGVVCSRGPVTIFYDLFRTERTLAGYYDRTVANAGATQGVGSCQTSEVSEGFWAIGDDQVGRLLCYTSGNGRRIAVWTFDRLRIASWAQRGDGNRAALYRFWLGPHSGPLE